MEEEKEKEKEHLQYCNNCGKQGHLFYQCKSPITSLGIIVFRMYNNIPSFLMIRRKDTLGYIDFMRGKYSIYNKEYIMSMFKQMTNEEKNNILSKTFDVLWKEIWGENALSNQYKTEEIISKEKFSMLNSGVINKYQYYNLKDIIEESYNYDNWIEPEWGFPKGRRNFKENDYNCAIREFEEETGYSSDVLININNIIPFEELFTGSNYKSYKHKYYLMYMKYEDSLINTVFQTSEVSKIEWKTYDKCIIDIRDYNLEKKKIITNIYYILNHYKIHNNVV